MSYKLIIAFLIAGSAYASTIVTTLTGVGTYTPQPTATYTETVRNLGSGLAFGIYSDGGGREAGNSPCGLGIGGCDMGDFSVLFPQIVIPYGYSLVNAQIELTLAGGLLIVSPYQVISLTPVDPSLPYLAGTFGSHYESLKIDACYVCGVSIGSFGDYTDQVNRALFSSNGVVTVVGDWNLQYGFETEMSASAGFNDVTVFQQTLSLPTQIVSGTLVVTMATPEPSTFAMFALTILSAWLSFRRLRRAR